MSVEEIAVLNLLVKSGRAWAQAQPLVLDVQA